MLECAMPLCVCICCVCCTIRYQHPPIDLVWIKFKVMLKSCTYINVRITNDINCLCFGGFFFVATFRKVNDGNFIFLYLDLQEGYGLNLWVLCVISSV